MGDVLSLEGARVSSRETVTANAVLLSRDGAVLRGAYDKAQRDVQRKVAELGLPSPHRRTVYVTYEESWWPTETAEPEPAA